MNKKLIYSIAATSALLFTSQGANNADAAVPPTTVEKKVHVYQAENFNFDQINSFLQKYLNEFQMNFNQQTTYQPPAQPNPVKENTTLQPITPVNEDTAKPSNNVKNALLDVSPMNHLFVKARETLWNFSQFYEISEDDNTNRQGIQSHDSPEETGNPEIVETNEQNVQSGPAPVETGNSDNTETNEQNVQSSPAPAETKTPEPAGKEITVTATAYTAECEGCSGITKTGVDLKADPDAKVIAVDPAVIPLGSKVHVEGYGYATAEDIGGGIDGNEIDVFVHKQDDALQWGRKQVKVTVID